MSTQNTTQSPPTSRLSPRDTYRLDYMALNHNRHVPQPYSYAYPTEEFPILKDEFCNGLVLEYVDHCMKAAGTTPERSNVPFQGWCERAARAAGLQGMEMPSSFFGKLRMRYDVFMRFTRLTF